MEALLEKTEIREWMTLENNNQRIFGVLHRPIKEDNSPIVVFLHGFASNKQGTRRGFVYLAEALAKEKIASLRFDFRGAGDSEGRLSELNFNDLVSDAEIVFNQLSHIKGIDTKRLGVFGSSLGGAIGVLSSAVHRNIKALALWAPVASGELWYHDEIKQNPELIDADISKVFSSYQGETINPLFREQFAQMQAAKVMGSLKELPLLHMHGEEDATLSLAHQEAFRQYGNPYSRFISYPETGHAVGCSAIFPEVVKECTAWFKKHL